MKPEIRSDGKTVWVNDTDGRCLGRFSRFGIDVHTDAAGQSSGVTCLDCKPGPTTVDDWMRFREDMLQFYGIRVAERHMPNFLKTPATVISHDA